MAYDTTTSVTDDLSDNLASYHNQLKTAIDHLMSTSAYGSYVNAASMTGNVTLTNSDFPIQSFSPTAARDLTLPTVASTNHAFYVINRGSYTITVKNAGGTTITTVTAGSSVLLISDGTNGWYAFSGGGGGDSKLVQRVEGTPNTTYSSITTAIPVDDTIPQNTEGGEVCTVTITPTNASNRLVIRAEFFGASDTALATVLALFQDSTAGALAARSHQAGAANALFALDIKHEMAAGTTSATTFKLRVGNNGGATTYVNGTSAGRRFGGVTACRISVEEIKV